MVDKYSGRVAYAVMKLKGSSGLFPLPWPLLDYNTAEDGYALDVSAEELADAPSFQASQEPEFDVEYRRTILVFYRPNAGGAGAPETADRIRSIFSLGRTTEDRSNNSEAPSAIPAGA